MGKLEKAEEVVSTYSKLDTDMVEPKDKHFMLHNVEAIWDPKLVIGIYRRGEVDIEYIKQCWYW
jgi:hypothetical protein